MTFSIHTLGCKVNIYESEFVTNLMINNGYELVEDNAMIYIINTCVVTNEAEKKDRKIIHNIRNNNKDAILIVMGCYSQLKSEEIDADIIIGNMYKSMIPELIQEYLLNKKKIVKIEELKNVKFEDMYINRFESHTRAFVKIQDGCNAYCTYCAIPYARGNLRSKPLNKVKEEITLLVNNGYHEIVLTGIHTGKYGIDIGTNLETLLFELVKIPNIYRIRLSSIEINEITPGIINLIKYNDIMAKHLHIPIQSGSNEILRLMNRHYDKEYFINKIEEIRNMIDNINITTDLIVGFPGETEELFNETLDTLNRIKFTKIHTFPYSMKSGTVASKMNNQIDTNTKKDRVNKVIRLSNLYEYEYYNSNIGKCFDGIVENRKDNKKIVITSNYIAVLINDQVNNNEMVKLKITSIDEDIVIGKILE